MEKQLKVRQICLFFISFMPIIKFFILPSLIAQAAEEDMWLSSLFNVGLDLTAILSTLYISVKYDTDFYSLLNRTFGKVFAKVLMGFYAVFFLLKAINPILELAFYVKLTLYEAVPSDFYFMAFFLVPFFLSLKPLRVIGRCADVFWIFTIIGIVILLALSVPNVDLGVMLPIGARGTLNVFKGSYRSLNWFGDGVYMLFFMGNFKCEKKGAAFIVLSYIAASLLVILYMVMFYAIFSSTADRQSFSLTEISKYSTSINNIGRFDYIGIIFILASEVFAISLPLYFGTHCVKLITERQKDYVTPIIYVLIPIIILLFLRERLYTLGTIILTYGSAFFALMANVIPLLTLTLKKGKPTENKKLLGEKKYALS